MKTQQIVWTIVAGALILFWLVFALAGTRKPNAAGAIVVMEYGRVLRLLALIAALSPPTLMATMVWHLIWRSEERLAIAGCSFLAVSLLGGLLLIEIVRLRIVLTEEGITRSSPWTGTVMVKWGDIKSVKWSPINRWFVIQTGSATVRVSRFLLGGNHFRETLRRKVAAERWVGAQEELIR